MGHLGVLFILLLCSCLRAGGHKQCKKDEFPCRNSRCIAGRFLCNGVNDCGDRSDEDSCQNCTTTGVFSCGKSDICLPAHKLCDGHLDCADGRDEDQKMCGIVKPSSQSSGTCEMSEFQCVDGNCILHAWRCDNSPDCFDGSDEVNCDQNECLVNNGGCSHICSDDTMGFHCRCPENMRLVGGSQCEEIDRCLEADVCDQLCIYMNGNFTCDCSEGYDMNPTSTGCKAKGGDAQMVFTSSGGLKWTSVTGTGRQNRPRPPQLSGTGSLAASASNRTLYWAPHGQGAIYRVWMDENPQKPLLVLKVKGSVSALALDWIHRLLYWSDVEGGSVNVVLLDSLTQHQLTSGLDRPSALAVEPLQGLLFWAQCGSFPKIERSALDGRDRLALVTSYIHCPSALSLDMPRQLLYWADEGRRSISRVNLKGQNRKTVVESNGYLDRPFGLAVFEGFVYWSDKVTQSICRANKHNGSQLLVLLKDLTSPGVLTIIQPALQPHGPSVCGHAVCGDDCVVSLKSDRLDFSCISTEKGDNKSREDSTLLHAVPVSSRSDAMFAGILSLITFLSLLLVGMAVWWWRRACGLSPSVTADSFSLGQSQDPLIIQGGPVCQNSCSVKETLIKLDLDRK